MREAGRIGLGVIGPVIALSVVECEEQRERAPSFHQEEIGGRKGGEGGG